MNVMWIMVAVHRYVLTLMEVTHALVVMDLRKMALDVEVLLL